MPRPAEKTDHGRLWCRLATGLACGLSCLCGIDPFQSATERAVAAAYAQEEEPAPPQAPEASERPGADEVESPKKISELPIPTVEELRTNHPADWVILWNESVLQVERITQRPGTLALMQAALDDSLRWPNPVTQAEREDQARKRNDLRYLKLLFADDPNSPEFRIDMKHIKEIWHFEDLIVKRLQMLLDDGDLATALDLFLFLESVATDWPGSAEVFQRYLWLDAQQVLSRNEPDQALPILIDLWRRNPEYPQVQTQIGSVVDTLIQRAIETDDFRQARFHWRFLAKRLPSHPVVARWKQELTARASAQLTKAATALAAGEPRTAVLACERAARVWPQLPGLLELHAQATERYGILTVGVTQLAGESAGDAIDGEARERDACLREIPWFEPVRMIPGSTTYRSRFFEEWEPTDLGRDVRIWLKTRRGEPSLSAAAFLLALERRLAPGSPLFDERLTSSLRRIEVTSPTMIQLSFRQIPLRIEALLSARTTLADSGLDISPAPDSIASPAIGGSAPMAASSLTGRDAPWNRFQRVPADLTADAGISNAGGPRLPTVRYQRSATDTPRQPGQLDEVLECRYRNWDALLQGLLRGEVTMTPRVMDRDLPLLRNDQRFSMLAAAVPRVHWVQFSPDSPATQLPELRRALLLGVNRDAVIKDVWPNSRFANAVRISNGLFPSIGYGYYRNLSVPASDPIVATTLVAAARKKQQGQLTALRMLAPPEEDAQEAARRLCDNWRRLGIEVDVVTAEQLLSAENGDDVSAMTMAKRRRELLRRCDLVYRRGRSIEPLYDLWPLLTFDPAGTVDGLETVPDWLRQRLVLLESSTDWESAIRNLHKLQAELLAEVRFIPLWEIDELGVYRKRVTNLPLKLIEPYQDVDRWQLQSWYADEWPE